MPGWKSIATGAFLGAVFGFLAVYFPSPEPLHTLDFSMELVDKFRQLNKTCFILGASGESGKALLKELLRLKPFSRIVLIGRRKLDYNEEEYKKLEQRVVDFDKLENYQNEFSGFDVGYCCLGTTRGKAGAEGFVKIEHDYVVGSAKLALQGGTRHFHLVSSQGVDEKSSFLYMSTKVPNWPCKNIQECKAGKKMHLLFALSIMSGSNIGAVRAGACFKGRTDREICEMGFERASIYRPAVLMVDRTESRPMETMFRAILKPVACIAPTWMTTPIDYLAKAMIMSTVTPAAGAEIIDNKKIHAMAKSLIPAS